MWGYHLTRLAGLDADRLEARGEDGRVGHVRVQAFLLAAVDEDEDQQQQDEAHGHGDEADVESHVLGPGSSCKKHALEDGRGAGASEERPDTYPQEDRISALPGQGTRGWGHGIGVHDLALYLPQPRLGLSKSHPHRHKTRPEVTRRVEEGKSYLARVSGLSLAPSGCWDKVNSWDTLRTVL